VAEGDLKSLLWKSRLRVSRSLVPSGAQGEDDFDWNRYHLEYLKQVEGQEESLTLRLTSGDWSLQEGEISLRAEKPLHPNHKLLYETILELGPQSVLEAGCGGGDHLHNLALLLPHANIRGVDRSLGQLETLRRRNPEVAGWASVMDLTLPAPRSLTESELTFTQAVVMHIQTGSSHKVALWNLFHLSTQYVLLMENWARHDFVGDLQEMQEREILPWSEMHLYVRRLSGRPHLLVASRTPLEMEPLPSSGMR
jgi:hypothetical protein